ncbi:MAG: DUF4956 domain-containing protein, partial [Oscillibacter sp.]|nr:DUF4956 domain-containing protein [Oscillibacter sp.]
AAVGSLGVFLVLLVFGSIKSDDRMLLVIRGKRSIESGVESLVFKSFNHKAILRVKNSTSETLEYIYEVSSSQMRKAQQKDPNLMDSFYAVGNVEYVNFVLQNDEVSG